MKKLLFDVTGMTCSACSARVEKGIAKLDGVENVSVNLLKNSMSVTFDEAQVNTDKIIEKVVSVGYGAALHETTSEKKEVAIESEPDKAMNQMKKRLIISAIFTIPLFYLAMGEMFDWPLPAIFLGMENAMVRAFTQVLLVIPVLVAGAQYFRVGFRHLFRLSPNMDSLIAMGASAAFFYGIYAIYKISWGFGHGNMDMVHQFSMDLYFESAAMILTLITLGKFFEARAKSRTSEAIQQLIDLTPKTAVIIKDGMEESIPVEEVIGGDVLTVKAGDSVPVDGVIIEGYGAVDESAITGESLPVEKQQGDPVTGGTVNKDGYFKMEATAVGENTTLAKIVRLVDEATSSKAPIAKLADKISGVFVPIVILIALAAAIIWIALGRSFEFGLSTAISVLVISCPCALGLATPTAIMVGTGRGAATGILIKSAESLEIAHRIDTIVLDKTGTVTEGNPVVTDVIAMQEDEPTLLGIAASLEKMSNHPLSEPIIAKAEAVGATVKEIKEFEMLPGQGLAGYIEGVKCCAGNLKMMKAAGVNIQDWSEREAGFAENGKTPLFFSMGDALLGIIAVKDPVKPTSNSAIKDLDQMGINTVMLTGDNKKTAAAIGEQVGIKQVIAEVLPEEKEQHIRRLQDKGHIVAMVGDGINDAPALARANVGIAIGAGTDIAIESADIVLMKNDLMDVPGAISLSRAVIRNIKQNLFWAFIYNIIGIPVAAGILYSAFGLLLNPMIAAAAMSFSSVSVVLNALRLRFYSNKQRQLTEISTKKERNKTVKTKTIKIEGMSCGHCTAAVERALKGVAETAEVTVSLEEKTAVIKSSGEEIADEVLRSAIEEAGYQVNSIS